MIIHVSDGCQYCGCDGCRGCSSNSWRMCNCKGLEEQINKAWKEDDLPERLEIERVFKEDDPRYNGKED